jgi:hypothetical protein
MSSINTVDPFTLISVSNIPKKYRFKFKDNYNNTYIFNAIEFEYFLKNNKVQCNPYNNQNISKNIIKKLKRFMSKNKLKKISRDEFDWNNKTQLYTEISILMENFGFYNNVKWFDIIDYDVCCKIIDIFRKISPPDCKYFKSNLKISSDNYVYGFSKEVIKIFKDNDFMVCCNLFKSFSFVIDDFYENIPEWICDIETEIHITENQYLYIFYNIANNSSLKNIKNSHKIFYTTILNCGILYFLYYYIFLYHPSYLYYLHYYLYDLASYLIISYNVVYIIYDVFM